MRRFTLHRPNVQADAAVAAVIVTLRCDGRVLGSKGRHVSIQEIMYVRDARFSDDEVLSGSLYSLDGATAPPHPAYVPHPATCK